VSKLCFSLDSKSFDFCSDLQHKRLARCKVSKRKQARCRIFSDFRICYAFRSLNLLKSVLLHKHIISCRGIDRDRSIRKSRILNILMCCFLCFFLSEFLLVMKLSTLKGGIGEYLFYSIWKARLRYCHPYPYYQRRRISLITESVHPSMERRGLNDLIFRFRERMKGNLSLASPTFFLFQTPFIIPPNPHL